MSKQPIDRLMDEARTMGESRMIRDADPTKLTAEQAAEVHAAARAFKDRTKVSWVYIARQIGTSAPTLSEVLRGCYKGNWQQITLDLDRWLEDEAKRDNAPKPTEFILTAVAEEIQLAAEAASTLKGIAVVYGDAGIGKTLALQAVRAEKPGSIMISVESAAATAGGVIAAVARELRAGLSHSRHVTARHVLGEIKEKLAATTRLLIVDEVHKLCDGSAPGDKAIDVLRDLHDHTGIPMLWAGTLDMVAYLEKRRVGGKVPLAQIASRICFSRDLHDRTLEGGGGGEPLYTTEEVRKVFAKSKLRLAPDAIRYLMQLANIPAGGALRTCRNLVIMATKVELARDKSATLLTADMLRAAHGLLVSRRALSLLNDRLEADARRPAAMARAAG